MDYKLIKKASPKPHECLVIGIFNDAPDEHLLKEFNQQYQSLPERLIKNMGKEGDIVWQAELRDNSLVIIDCGKKDKFNSEKLKKRLGEVARFLLKKRISSAVVCMPLLKDPEPNLQLQQMILDFEEVRYQFLDFKTTKDMQHTLESLSFYLPGATEKAVETALCIAKGIKLTRDLANLPANICTPTYLAEEAIELAACHDNLQAKIIHKEEMLKLGMGALLAVAKGSVEPPQLIELQYTGTDKNVAPIMLVGKGITFDSGGISIKPAELMNEMKYDMAGAAAVLGTIKACMLLKLPVNITGLIASAENMPGGNATKPGDIIHSMQGLTVEITNTDAEGRLVLADALTYGKRFKPSIVIDIATLTGAMIIALGHVMTGFMTNDDDLAKLIANAAKDCGDKAWRLPLDDAYESALDSPIADLTNCPPNRAAGSITAATFLSRFTKDFRWAHLDIAGTAWISGNNREATGRPVSLLVQLIQNVANNKH